MILLVSNNSSAADLPIFHLGGLGRRMRCPVDQVVVVVGTKPGEQCRPLAAVRSTMATSGSSRTGSGP